MVSTTKQRRTFGQFCFEHSKYSLETIEKSNVQRNISLSQQKSMTALTSYENIIIKQADKEGAIVVMDKVF